mgnify:CR=1 FL=1
MEQTKGYVHSLESFGSADGPGVRYIIFLSGCAMRCQFCHNPDTWDMQKGTLYTAKELIDRAWRYRNYWGKDGGITISGGEPLLQIDFLLEFFKLAKAKGIHTTLDTAGNPFTREEPFFGKFRKLMELTDLVMLDFKEMDGVRHKELTGVANDNILDLARYLSDTGKDMWIRHVLVPGLTDQEDDLKAMRGMLDELKTVKKVEILPYHSLGLFKWQNLGIPYTLEGVPAPTKEEVEQMLTEKLC